MISTRRSASFRVNTPWGRFNLFRALAATIATVSLLGSSPLALAQPGGGGPTCGPGVQLLGFSDVLDKGSFEGFDVAELSGVTYNRGTHRYYAVADRAGTVPAHFFTLKLPLTGQDLGAPTIEALTVLRDSGDDPYNGFSFDGEGIAQTDQRTVFVASEGGSGGTAGPQDPEIRRFSLEGDELDSLEVPARFLVGTNNLSFESLGSSPNGRSLFTASERPLPALGSSPADGQTAGQHNRIRILRYEDRGPAGFVPAEQFFYLTDPDRAANDVGVVDLIALSERELLVLERGFVMDEGNTVRVYRVDLTGADDVSGQPTLDDPNLQPLAKSLVFDLADCPDEGATVPPGAIQPNALLDNFEAMTLGPVLSDGRRALVLLSDDNGSPSQTTRVIALALENPRSS
jgi:hypothetical protein